MQTKKQARIAAQETNGGFIPAYSPQHRLLRQELSRKDIRWAGIKPIKERVRRY